MELTLSAAATPNVFGVRILPSKKLTPLHLLPAPKAVFRRPLACVSSSAASFALGCSGGGGGGGGGGVNGGDGGGGGDGGKVKVDPIAVGADNVSSDVIILDVKGMSCGGCSGKVKRILESQPLVSAATVNLKTETAIVWAVAAAKLTPNWKKDLGEKLAKHLTTCGFNSNIRGEVAIEEEAS